MFSRLSPRAPRFDISQDRSEHFNPPPPPPPPPPRDRSNGPSSGRSGNFPPTVNTNVPYVPGAVLSSTPVATPSLSSPFPRNPELTHATSGGTASGPASRGVSPAVAYHRLSGNFNMTYDPRDWATGTQSVEASRQRHDVYGQPLNTPPPPYTGTSTSTSQEQRSSTSSAFSRAATSYASSSASLNTTPIHSETTIPGEPGSHGRHPKPNTSASLSRQAYDLRRATHLYNVGPIERSTTPQHQPYNPQSGQLTFSDAQAGSHSRLSQSNVLPPPPPRADPPRIGSTDTDVYQTRTLLGARRSTSAGPTPTAGLSVHRPLRTVSDGTSQDQHEWTPGMPLPGPPPLPPPPSQRSRSASAHGEDPNQYVSQRPRPPRLYLRNSNLATIPATPSSVASGTSTSAMPFPLRIDTGSVPGHGKVNAEILLVDKIEPVQTGSSVLARRSAIRGLSARGIKGRSRSRSVTARSPVEAPPSSTFSTNPWASALEQTKSSEGEILPESAVLPVKGKRAVTTNVKSHTPPATPNLAGLKERASYDQSTQQTKILPTPPLSQKPLHSANSVEASSHLLRDIDQNVDYFTDESLERHKDFLRREKEATTDAQRLTLFVSYMQQESLIRKERYLAAFKSDEFDIEAAKGMLFNATKVRRASRRDSEPKAVVAESPVPTSTNTRTRTDAIWSKDYRPALSPIASLEHDEMSSRGRAPSRWWESQTGSRSDGISQGVYRTKRESKYMSLSKKLLENMETEMESLPEDQLFGECYPSEKANPDTFGYYEDDYASPPLTSRSLRQTPRPSTLDISRFITLPPPYPRHHPAVNNSHPDLASYRSTVRMLSDFSDAKSRQNRHQMSLEALRIERRNRVAELRRCFKADIQGQIAEGVISYAQAAEAEKALREEESAIEKEGLQAEFETLQDVVVNPLHEQYNERIDQLTTSLHSLQRELVNNATNQDPDQPVQEGDDVPELLEQLTQLKWLFEARENLYQETFNLLTQRNDAYSAIVVHPYRQSNNVDKIRDTEAFFEKDTATRHASDCTDALKRHEAFLRFIEDNALRGIEMQLSAFWDITPGLVDLINKIPEDSSKLDIHIPDEELQENPSYHEHPQQYLYLLLRHAEKSSYQYIEGQINLHCLVHEVKTSSLAAHYRASRAQQTLAGDQSINLADTKSEDEGELTEELKNRANMIEEQWQDALGKHFTAVQQRVREQLQNRGAWEQFQAESEGS